MDKKDLKLVSVIVPVYNADNYFGNCVESIINQTYKNIEIILVDDESKDNAGKMCDEYAKKDDRIIVIHKKNGGASSTRNVGLKKAKGEIVCFVDCDDYLELNMIEVMVDEMNKNDSDIVVCKFFFKDGDKLIPNEGDTSDVKIGLDYMKYILNGNISDISVWSKIFKKSVLEDIWFDETIAIYEDFLFLFKVLEKNVKITYIDNFFYYYVKRPDSAMNTLNVVKRIKNYKVLVEIYGMAKKYNLKVKWEYLCIIFERYMRYSRYLKYYDKILEQASKELYHNIIKNKEVPLKNKIRAFLIMRFSKLTCFLLNKKYVKSYSVGDKNEITNNMSKSGENEKKSPNNNEVMIRIRGVKKKYKLGQIGTGSLKNDLQSLFAKLKRKRRSKCKNWTRR